MGMVQTDLNDAGVSGLLIESSEFRGRLTRGRLVLYLVDALGRCAGRS